MGCSSQREGAVVELRAVRTGDRVFDGFDFEVAGYWGRGSPTARGLLVDDTITLYFRHQRDVLAVSEPRLAVWPTGWSWVSR
jgi:hypothetical protein